MCGTSVARVVRAARGSTLNLMMHQKQQDEDPLSLPEDKLDEKHLVLVAKSTRLKQREHEAREGASEEEEDSRRSVEDDCLPQDNGRTRVDSVPLSTSTPFPRAEMHTKKIRSPDHFRTQYLSNLGIWADNQAKQLTSAPRTEARYRRNVGYACLRSSCFLFLLGLRRHHSAVQLNRNVLRSNDYYIFILIYKCALYFR